MTPLLKELLERISIEDIVLSGRGLSYFENGGWHGPLKDSICEERNLFILSRRIADRANLTLGLTQPSADSFIDFNGEHLFRAHVVVAPMALHGTEITLRRVRQSQLHSLESFGIPAAQKKELLSAVHERKSILIAGATGAGKSSLLSALMSEIPAQDRVLILEDSPELPIPNKLSTKLLARADRFGFREGAQWDLSHLVFESLRMRPDRILVGECRGPEAKAIAQALMTGHKGVMTTLHAGSSEEALDRFEKMLQTQNSSANLFCRSKWDLVLHVKLSLQGERQVSDFLYETDKRADAKP